MGFFKVFDVVIYLFLLSFPYLRPYIKRDIGYCVPFVCDSGFLCFSGAETILGPGGAHADTAPVTGGTPTTIVTVVWTRSD